MGISMNTIRFTLLFALLAVTACVAAQEQTAGELYHDYCSVCHGDKGDGRSRASQGLVPPPKDFTSQEFALAYNRDAMVNVVLHGKPGTAMTAWKARLTKQQAEAIVDFIRGEFILPVFDKDDLDQAASSKEDRGAQLYADNCSVCHGDKGAGSIWASSTLIPPPRDFSSAALSRDRMIASVSFGRPGTSMPAFGSQLSAEDIELVVDFIHSTIMPQVTENNAVAKPETPATKQPRSDNVSIAGDFKIGQAFYMANCSTCHGVNGDGAGPRAYFIFPKPRNFRTATTRAAFDRQTLFDAIKLGVPGREMPAWGKVLSDQQIANVTEYVYRTFFLENRTSNPGDQ